MAQCSLNSILQGRVFCVTVSVSLGNVSRRYRSLFLLQTLDLSLLVQLACDQPLLNILSVTAYLCIIQSFNLMTTLNSHLNVAIWVRGWFGLIMLMLLCTWRPQGNGSSHSYILHLRSLFNGKLWLSDLLWMSLPSYRRFGVCNSLKKMGGLLPGNLFHSAKPIFFRSYPASCQVCQCDIWKQNTAVFTTILSHLLSPWKTVLQRLSYVGPGFLGFFFLSELLGVDTTVRSKCFQRNVFLWPFCQLLAVCLSLFP